MKYLTFCDQVGKKLGIPRATARESLTLIFQELVELLHDGDEIKIPRFGKFSVVTKPPGNFTGESVDYELPERRRIELRFDTFPSLNEHMDNVAPETPINEGIEWLQRF